MTVLRLAVGHNANMMLHGFSPEDPELAAMLCSYFYLWKFDKFRDRLAVRDWSLDSGAYSAYNIGERIDLVAYTDVCRERLASDPQLVEVFALDVIGDHDQSRRNVEVMWEHGVPAIPTYHYGEPEALLTHYAQNYPKMALGGIANLRGGDRHRWLRQCFARIWPTLVHGFAVTAASDLLCVPWHSVDSSSWQMPAQYGGSKALKINPGGRMVGNSHVKMRTSYKAMARPEVNWYLRLERQAKAKWGAMLATAEAAARERFPSYAVGA